MQSLQIITSLKKLRDPKKAEVLCRFFKTGKGEYAEGDTFMGVTVPKTRHVAKTFEKIPLTELQKIMESPLHEARLCGLIILTKKYNENPKAAYELYLKNTRHINNWDLVDTSAEYIIGRYLCEQKKMNPLSRKLTSLAHSKNLWERRIAMLSTFHCIKHGDPEPALGIAKILVNDSHDLIHKAVGWMLREVGKRCSEKIEEEFLQKHVTTMPRTMLRYAIERFPKNKREWYLRKK